MRSKSKSGVKFEIETPEAHQTDDSDQSGVYERYDSVRYDQYIEPNIGPKRKAIKKEQITV